MHDEGIHMTRLLLITLLVLSSGPAYAEWVAINGSRNTGGYTRYADLDTIRRDGDLVKMWVLYDYKTTQTVVEGSYLSSRGQKQFDCGGERHQRLVAAGFSGNMGTGNIVWSEDNEGKWQPVAPGSVGQLEWKLACRKQ